jgi:hypothetical protein
MREIEDLLVADAVQDVRHRSVVAAAAVVLVFAQCFHEVVLALGRDARNVALAGIIAAVAEAANGSGPKPAPSIKN